MCVHACFTNVMGCGESLGVLPAESGYNSYALPAADLTAWDETDPTNPHIDWNSVAADYENERVAVVDDLFSPEALAELLDFTLTASVFRTMRAGFLGAFPADGKTSTFVVLCIVIGV